MHRVRLLVAYEAPGGALRTTQLALEFHVVAALSAGALMLAPVPRQLAAWRLDVSLRQHREVQAHAQLAGGRFDVAAVGARCGYWRLTGAGEAGGAGAAQVCALTTSVSVEGASSGTVRVELAPRPQDGNGALGGEAPEALQPMVTAETSSGASVPRVQAVTVQKGDTLWAISQARYGSGFLYVRVFEANKGDIRNPDLIYPGQIFTLPE